MRYSNFSVRDRGMMTRKKSLQVPLSTSMPLPYMSQQFPTSSLPLSMQGLPPQYAQMLAQQHGGMAGMGAGFPFLQGEFPPALSLPHKALS